MVANAKRLPARKQTPAEEAAEERALAKLNRMFAKAAPLAARRRKQALKRLSDAIAARIQRGR